MTREELWALARCCEQSLCGCTSHGMVSKILPMAANVLGMPPPRLLCFGLTRDAVPLVADALSPPILQELENGGVGRKGYHGRLPVRGLQGTRQRRGQLRLKLGVTAQPHPEYPPQSNRKVLYSVPLRSQARA
jgi:hypothetical protein